MRFVLASFIAGLLVAGLTLSGCSSNQPAPAPSGGSPSSTATGENDAAAEIEAALAKLSPEDRALAEKQKICPVSEEPLGSMGTPLKVNVADRDVFICCEGCEKTLKADPDKYLTSLPAS
jgi:membrane fusion protein, copper/silver efflux system